MKFFLTVTSYIHGIIEETEEFDSVRSAKNHISDMAELGVDMFIIDNFESDETSKIEKRTHENWWQDAHNPNQTFWTEELNMVYAD